MYRKLLLSTVIVLLSARVIGGIVGTRKLIKASQVGLILVVTAAILLWILKGMAPFPPAWIDRAARYWPF